MAAVPTPAPGGRVAVIVVNYRTPLLTLDAIRAIAGERPALSGLRVVVVDGGSGDGSAETLAEGLGQPDLAGWTELIAAPINGGFGWANNQALLRLLQRPSPPDYIHLLNPDTIARAGAVAALARVLDAHPECGAVGSQLLEADGAPAGSAFGLPGIRTEWIRGLGMEKLRALVGLPPGLWFGEAREVGWVTGASVMLRAAALREVGLFDTGFFLYFEETELMLRMRRVGWTIRHAPDSLIEHVGGAATGVNGTRIVAERPPLPAYWYASRRRMFALAFGRTRATCASLAFLAGLPARHLRRLFQRARHVVPIRHEGRGLIRHGVLARASDTIPAAPRWDAPPGEPPAWTSA